MQGNTVTIKDDIYREGRPVWFKHSLDAAVVKVLSTENLPPNMKGQSLL